MIGFVLLAGKEVYDDFSENSKAIPMNCGEFKKYEINIDSDAVCQYFEEGFLKKKQRVHVRYNHDKIVFSISNQFQDDFYHIYNVQPEEAWEEDMSTNEYELTVKYLLQWDYKGEVKDSYAIRSFYDLKINDAYISGRGPVVLGLKDENEKDNAANQLKKEILQDLKEIQLIK